MEWLVNCTPWPFYPRRKRLRYPFSMRRDGPHSPSGCFGEDEGAVPIPLTPSLQPSDCTYSSKGPHFYERMKPVLEHLVTQCCHAWITTAPTISLLARWLSEKFGTWSEGCPQTGGKHTKLRLNYYLGQFRLLVLVRPSKYSDQATGKTHKEPGFGCWWQY
jgi:hypothetical protein